MRGASSAVVAATLALVLAASFALTAPALAQGWWPFGNENDRPPVPREPVYRQPAPQGAPPQGQPPLQQPGFAGGGARTPICMELEQRLVQEGQRGNESRTMVPMLEGELRRVDQEYRVAQQQLDRSDCYEYFLFSKTLRRTKKCIDLSQQVEGSRRRIADLETQLRQLTANSGRSYRDEIISELARNNCGANYQQQARTRDSSGSNFWDDGESGGAAIGGNFGNLGYATYRTVCVRLCDGYYFPVSFSTLPNHFERDAELCQSKCAAPAELYYHQNPGAGMEQATSAMSNAPYTQLKTAFRYRKEYVQGCSCKMAEFVPEAGAPQQQGSLTQRPDGSAASSWSSDAPAAATPAAGVPRVEQRADGAAQLPAEPRGPRPR